MGDVPKSIAFGIGTFLNKFNTRGFKGKIAEKTFGYIKWFFRLVCGQHSCASLCGRIDPSITLPQLRSGQVGAGLIYIIKHAKLQGMTTNRFVLIDAFALIFRAYHALPPMTNSHGVQLNAVYGFTSALLSSIKELHPEYLAVGFDLAKPTKRHKDYHAYKAHRPPAPPDLSAQIPYVKEVLKAFNIPIVAQEGYEGEDVIATIISKCKPQISKLEYIIVTGDLDCLQLVDEETKVYSMARGVNQAVLYDAEKVKERYGLTPEQFVDFKALKGDASDNIPGVKGIGEKTAISLIQKFGSLENLYQKISNFQFPISKQISNFNQQISKKVLSLLTDNKDQAFLSQKLSKIDNSAPIKFRLEDAKIHDYDQKKIINLFEKYGFQSLIKRLPDSSRQDNQQKLL